MRTLKKFLLHLFSLLVFTASAEVPDSLINIIDLRNSHGRSFNISVSDNGTNFNLIEPKWLFLNEDSPELRFGKRDEKGYVIVNSNSSIFTNKKDQGGFKFDDGTKDKRIFDTDFKGIGWYKCYFRIPSESTKRIYELEYMFHGAAEIYFDGDLQTKHGKISSDPAQAEELNITNGSVYFPISDTSIHCIAVRYGLINYKYYLDEYENKLQAPLLQLSIPEVKENNRTVLSVFFSVTNMLSAFFFSLFIIHFLIYIFYREQSFNLLYSLFLILLSFTFLELYLVQFIVDLKFYFWVESKDEVIFPTVCFILVTLLNRLLNEKRSWHYLFLCVVLVYHYIDVLFINELYTFSKVTIIMYTYFNTLAHSIKGIRRKVTSAKFLGWGILSLTICFILLIVSTFFFTLFLSHANSEINDAWTLAIYVILIIIGILSIPISMSAYLAYDFATTNRSLSKKLIEVKDLSAKNIEQEKEKQKILAEQNEVLEIQVEERTKEINEQKKVIEEKNKDITDSINYAQRIQRSILPTDEEIKDIFKDSFVLFKPRDIVSGDFYQFKKNGELRYAVLADCTGHGVPGALMSMIGSNLLKQIILERGVVEPNEILAALHKEVRSTLRQGTGVQSHDGMDAAIVLLRGKKLHIASANRPVYIVVKGELKELRPDKRSIGGSSVGDDVVFTLHELEVESGMMIYLFSDGYADQFGGDEGKKFKVKNLAQLLVANSAKPLDQQKEILDTTFNNWKKDLEQVDDVSLIGLKF